MSLHPRNTATNRYPLFAEIFPKHDDVSVLDFGGNQGNLLYFSNGKINPSKYTCIDVSYEAIQQGQKEFPQSTWHHFDRFNFMYNHNGQTNIMPVIQDSFDYIWAFSVFTHTDLNELIETIKWFKTLKCKKIAISLLDIQNQSTLEFFYNKRCEAYGDCIDIRTLQNKDHKVVHLLDNNQLITDQHAIAKIECKHFITFYNLVFLIEHLKQHGIHAETVRSNQTYLPFICI